MKRPKMRHRSKAAVSKTVKKVMSLLQIEHLDYFSKVHKHDVDNNRAFLGEVLGNADVAKLTDEQVGEVMEICGYKIIEQPTYVPYSDLMETSEFAENLCFEKGKWTSKRGDDWLKFVTNIIEEESVYYERGHVGNHKRRERDHNEEFREPLNVIFARTPPWLAKVLSEATDEQMVKDSITKVAAHFEKETGYKVHAVNVHREAGHDLHIHIMYSDVRANRIAVSGRNRKAQVVALKKELAEELKSSGMKHDKSSVKLEYEKRNLNSDVNEYTDEVEYRKVLRRGAKDDGEWPIEKRSMATMGTAYRCKGWIWDSATNPDDKDTICKFRDNSLINGNFTNKVAKVPHLEDRYLDWWLEKAMFRELYSGLSVGRQKLVDAGKDDAVASYLEYGQTVVHPMQQATLKHKVAIDKQKDEDREKLAKWKAEARASLSKYEAELRLRDVKIERSEIDVELDMAMNIIKEASVEFDRKEVSESFGRLRYEQDRVSKIESDAQVVLERESGLTDREEAVVGREQKLDARLKKANTELDERVKDVTVREETVEDKERKLDDRIKNTDDDIKERVKDVTAREETIVDREDEIREGGKQEVVDAVAVEISPPIPFRVVAIQGVADLRVKIQDHTESAREAGRREILDEVSAIIPPSIPEDSKEKDTVAQPVLAKRTRKEVLKDVAKVYTKARIWDKMKTHVETFVKKVESFKKPRKWMSDLVREIKTTLGMKDDPKDKKDQDVDR